MDSKVQMIEVYPFAYNKILGGQRKIDIRPYTERFQKFQVGDMITYVNAETQSHITREIKGIAIFDNFNTLIKMLPAELIGYQSKEEVRVRIERMFSREAACQYGVCALFIDEPCVRKMMKYNHFERSA